MRTRSSAKALLFGAALLGAALIGPNASLSQAGRDGAFGELDKRTRPEAKPAAGNETKPAPAAGATAPAPASESVAPAADGKGEAKAEAKADTRPQGTLSAMTAVELRLDLKVYDGEIQIGHIIAPGSRVGGDAVIAELRFTDLEDRMRKAHEALERIEVLTHLAELDLEAFEKSLPERRQSAERSLEDARSARNNFIKYDRDEALRNARLSVLGYEDSITDQEDELRQLKELYQSNDLAKESQDIVIMRSERRLERTREQLKTAIDREKELKETGLAKRERDLEVSLQNATRAIEEWEVNVRRQHLPLKLKLEEQRQSMRNWREYAEKLQGDAERRVIRAGTPGLFVHGAEKGNDGITWSFKAGDKIKSGTLIGTMIDLRALECTVQVPAAEIGDYEEGRAITAHIEGLRTDAPQTLWGRVAQVGQIVNKGMYSVRLTFPNAEAGVAPGHSVRITPEAAPRDRRRDGDDRGPDRGPGRGDGRDRR